MKTTGGLRSEPVPRVGLDPDAIVARSTEKYESLCERFARTGRSVEFDFREHCLAWTSRGDHYTHRLHRYPARLTPYIPIFFLGVKGVAVRGGQLLDPFAGCGTVLVEAPVHPAHPMSPVGFEINPLARLIAKVKTTPVDARAVRAAWRRVIARHDNDTSRAGLHQFPNKEHWFSKPVELRLARMLRAFEGLREGDVQDFLLVALSSVVRAVSLADPSVSVPVRLDPSRYDDKTIRAAIRRDIEAREDANVKAMLQAIVANNLTRLTAWSESRSIDGVQTAIVGADARTFLTAKYVGQGNLGDASDSQLSNVDLVLTSPPYANAQRYTRSLRLEQFVLGFAADGKQECQLDQLQVGTERVREKEWDDLLAPTGVPTADKAIKSIGRKDRFRAAIVGKYVRDMAAVLRNCYSAVTPGGHSIMVIGNNRVRGTVLDNAAILGELGTAAGFREVLRVRNKIPSRGLITKRHHTAGVITHERVLVLQKPTLAKKTLARKPR